MVHCDSKISVALSASLILDVGRARALVPGRDVLYALDTWGLNMHL